MRSTWRRRWALVAALAAISLAATACGGDDEDSGDDGDSGSASEPASGDEGGDGGDDAAGGDATLDVTEFEFADVSVPAGGALEVTNSSGGPHTVTADDGAFDEELPDGTTITVTAPAEPGDYPYHCEIHPSMAATLTVE